MTDREKVIKSIEDCVFHKHDCVDCDYDGCVFRHGDCRRDLLADALELLKERVKTRVVFGRNKDGSFETECGNCGTYLDKAYSRCPKCNRELDWNSNQT